MILTFSQGGKGMKKNRRSADRLLLLEMFLRVYNRKSLSLAAADLDVSQPTASRLVKELENELGTVLFLRNTRRLSTTESSDSLAKDAQNFLEDWNNLLDKHRGDRSNGVKLKVVAPVCLGQKFLFDIVSGYMSKQKNLRINWKLVSDQIAFREEGCDLWICLGPVPDDTLVVRKVGVIESLVVAAAPTKYYQDVVAPKDLTSYDAVGIESSSKRSFDVVSNHGSTFSIQPNYRVMTNNLSCMHHAILKGVGYGLIPVWCIADDLNKGTLVNLLPNWKAVPMDINVVYNQTRYTSPILEGLIDHIEKGVSSLDGIFN